MCFPCSLIFSHHFMYILLDKTCYMTGLSDNIEIIVKNLFGRQYIYYNLYV